VGAFVAKLDETMHKFINAIIFGVLGLALTACTASGSVSYQPPNLPIKISIDTNGHLEVSWENSIQTPIGTFSAEITSDLSGLYQDRNGVLIVNVDSVNSVYDLNGQDNIVITLESGYYQQVELRKEGNNWYFEAQRISNELSVQQQSTPASSGSDDCTEVVSASRELIQNGIGDTCWLKLPDGGSTDLVFNAMV
jgi:hypothetical protein